MTIRTTGAAGMWMLLAALAGCSGAPSPQTPVPENLQHAIEAKDALSISDALEALIAGGKDTERDRQLAYDQLVQKEEPTAAYAFARAAVCGRLVQIRGLTAALLVREMESYTLKSIEIDPSFREGAATRMLGTLYVLAPSSLLQKGDSEKGLELLEGLVKKHPETLENHLRYAEALIALGDAEPATASLCKVLADKGKLRRDEQTLADKLYQDAGTPACPGE